MKLSIVATLYNSARHLQEFHQRACATAQEFAADSYEIILVNDGSPDNSVDVAIRLAQVDPHVVVVDLSRNFGHHKAMMTGLAHASGDLIFLIDSDLEEEPEWLPNFADQMRQQAADVVYGVQAQRKGGWFERWSGEMFYRVLNLLSGMKLPEHVVTARLMTRRYVNALLLHQEREVFIVGLWHLTGFEQRAQPITKHNTSESNYTLSKKIEMAVNAVTSFSNKPLVWVFNVGALISVLAACYVAYLIISWLFFAKPAAGWTSVMASVWLVGGMVICFMGVIGIYLSKIFSEVKQRPYSIVRAIHRHADFATDKSQGIQ